MSEFDIRDFEAPIAVRTLELSDDEIAGFDLGTSQSGAQYSAAYVVVTRSGRPTAEMTLAAESDGTVTAETVRRGLEGIYVPAHSYPEHSAVESQDERPHPHVSVVIACIDDGKLASRCIDAILEGSYQNVEIIVVNNRPQNGGLAFEPGSAAASDPRVRTVDEQNSGLSHARNRGASIARGEIIAFTDDDVVPGRDWITGLVDAFDTHPGTSCVTGMILPLELETDAQCLLERYAGFSKGYKQRVFRLEDQATDPLFPYNAGQFGSGANIAITADAMRRIGGLDNALGTGTPALGGEDIDLFIRLMTHGHQMVYEPAAVVWHQHPVGDARLERQVFCYGAGLISAITKQAIYGPKRMRLLRAIPSGIRLALAPNSEKNARKGNEFPRSLTIRELIGMAYGPIAFLRSSRRNRGAAPKTSAAIVDLMPDFTPAFIKELDLGHPIEAIDANANTDHEVYRRARLIVRLHRVPVGIVELPLTDGRASAEEVLAVVNADLGERIAEHLANDGLPAEQLTVAGMPSTDEPRCLASADASTDEPLVTVIVCTRDRAESLARALRSILAVEYSNFEVVLVDNAPTTNDTRSVVDEFNDPRVRYVLEPIAGLSRARNRGLSEANGDIIAFTDDDVEVDAYWLRGLLHGFAHTDKVGCVTGVIPTTVLENESQQYFDDLVSWSEGFERRIFDLHENRDSNALYPYSAGMFGAGANFAIRREAVQSIGTFDEALGAGAPTRGGEDLDYFARMVLGGWAIVYEPLALVWHYHRADNESLKNQIWGYGTGATAYGIKTAMSWKHGPKIAWLLVKYVARRAKKDPALGEIDLGYGELRKIQVRGLYAGPFLYVKGRWAARNYPPLALSTETRSGKKITT